MSRHAIACVGDQFALALAQAKIVDARIDADLVVPAHMLPALEPAERVAHVDGRRSERIDSTWEETRCRVGLFDPFAGADAVRKEDRLLFVELGREDFADARLKDGQTRAIVDSHRDGHVLSFERTIWRDATHAECT